MASVKAQIVLDFTGVIAQDQIIINVNGSSEIFTATDGPPSGNLFSIGQGNDYGATAHYFTVMFNSNYPNGYTLTRVGAVVTIDADNWSDIYNFGTPGGNITVVSQRDNNVDPMVITMTPTNILCFGASTGAIDVEITGGATPLTYAWDDGPFTNKDRIGLSFGNGQYKITVTDAIGNQSSKTTNIYQPPEINISGTTVLATGGGANGSIDVTVFGGVGPYTYAWSDGPATTQDRANIIAGIYTVTVTDNNGCQKQANFTVIDGGSTIVITPSILHVTCYGEDNGEIQTVISGGVAPYTYLWLRPNGSEIIGSGTDITDFIAGIYHLTVTDNVGSIQAEFIEITQPPLLVVTSAVNGNSIELTVVGGIAPYTYLWSTTETSKDITVPAEGNYSVTVTDDNGCTKNITVTVAAFSFFFVDNPIELWLEADGGQVNHSFVCEVYIEHTYLSGTFIKVVELEQGVSTLDDTTVFDVKEVISAYMLETLPLFNENQIKLADGHFKRFNLRYAEKYGEPPVPTSFTQESTFYAFIGGLSDLEFSAATFINDFLPQKKPFFTWEPLIKDVFSTTQIYLNYMVNEFNTPAIELHIKIYYTDETSLTTQIINVITTPNRFELYRIPVGHNQLQLAAQNPTKSIESYEVWLEDGLGNVKSEVRTFNLVEDPTFSRTFIYLNSLGGWSTLIAEGYAIGKLKVKETALQQKLERGYATTDTEIDVIKKTGQQQLLVKASATNNVEAAHLQDFAISSHVFEVKENRFEPVRIKFNINYLNEESNYIKPSFVVLPPLLKKYTPSL